MAHLPEKEVFAKTLYAEARGESEEGQKWVAWVIKNRARMNRTYWGGSSIKDVCLFKNQFECWNNKSDIEIKEPQVYERIRRLTDKIYDAPHGDDPTGGTDHYHNPDKEGHQPWVDNCKLVRRIGNHVFYKGP
jgi:N-acetylmuramoyl-L-alanine amidase